MKNQFKFLFFMLIISGIISLMGCNSNASDAKTNEDLAESNEQTANATASWEDFWQTFQAAAAAQDKEKIAELCVWSDAFLETNFNESYEMFFPKAMLDLIATTPANAIPINAEIPVEVDEPREIALHESSIEDGETYESALFLYFGKVNGRYALVQFMAAG